MAPSNRSGFEIVCLDRYSGLRTEQIDILGYLSILSASLSVIGSGSIIIYSLSRRICRGFEVRPLFHLSIADLLLAVLWISGASVHLQSKEAALGKRPKTCFILQSVTEMVHVITFFLTVNYAFGVWRKARKKYVARNPFDYILLPNNESRLLQWWIPLLCYLTSWIFPFLLFIPLALQINKLNVIGCQRCIILLDVPKLQPSGWKHYGYIMLVGSLCLSIALLFVLYFLIYHMMSSGQQLYAAVLTVNERVQMAKMRQRINLYIMAFLICWTPALVLSIRRLQEQPANFAFLAVQVILAPLQGFLNSLVYGWSRRAFREAEQQLNRNYGNDD